jgi:ribosomal protein S18 acetylase RimI-like enzyme
MVFSTSISRFADFHRRNGLRATIRRIGLAAKRSLFSSRMALFYCDLSVLTSSMTDLPSSLKVERKRNAAEISQQDLQQITSLWNPKLAQRNMQERFGLGASLWLIRFEDQLAGYGWTLQGCTVEPHYFRLGPDDAHLFDFHVFSQYRGQGLNPLLVTQILHNLSAECHGRAFIEAAEWNQPQLASLRRTPFRLLGSARKLTLFRHTMVFWGADENARQAQDTFGNLPRPVTNPRSSEEKA